MQMSSGSDDFLELLDFGSGADSPMSSDHHVGSSDILDMFNNVNVPPTRPHKAHSGRNTVTALPIDPRLVKSGHRTDAHGMSLTLKPDPLFNEWMSFDENNKGSSSPKPRSNGTPNSSASFEAMDHAPSNNVDDEKAPPSKPAFVSKPPPKAPKSKKKHTASTPKLKTIEDTEDAESDDQEDSDSDGDDDHKKNSKETNALEELHRGAALLKYPRRSGFPHFKHIQLSGDNLRIEWFSKRKKPDQTCIWVKDIREVVRGQETEVFKKFHQKTLEKSSFSIVYGPSYRTLDVAAKSIDECEMWVKSILKLVAAYRVKKRESDLSSMKTLFVGIEFKDRNRPMSRQGSGNFIRANSSKNLKIDPVALKEIEKDMESLSKTYSKTIAMSQKPLITKSNQYANIQYVLSELEERIEELTYEVANIRDTELAKREVWRANVDLSAIQEKVEVLLKHLGNKSDRRKSNFI